MPLLDHFRPPLNRTHPGRGFHGAWAAAMARLLNAGVLPSGYYAVPFLDRYGQVEIDVAALRDFKIAASNEEPGTAADGDPRLVAAIELVSPRNKDRPSARAAFAAKCADHLRHDRGVVVVDVVTTRRADLHSDLLVTVGAESDAPVPGPLSVVSYRPVGREAEGRLLA